jgi:deazaflavin-dependent oxidoreductase (nitroreductase family)
VTRISRLVGRVLVALARVPALADRRGLRWLLSGSVIGAPIVLLVHRGRRTGKTYTTPVEAIAEDEARGEVVVSPMRGRRGDWYRNVVAGGLVEARLRGETCGTEWRELAEAERFAALRRYRSDHPLYGRMILWSLARMHRLSGDSLDAVAHALPMLALRRPGP